LVAVTSEHLISIKATELKTIDYVCRSCGSDDLQLVVDLGVQPLANSFVPGSTLLAMEPHYPLIVFRCPCCHLVQQAPMAKAEHIFSDYLYLSSYSKSWLDHSRAYVELVSSRFKLGAHSQVLEIASNDGYLLQYFVEKGIPALGIEPAANVAEIANRKGVPTKVAFFGAETARELVRGGYLADLTVANNVLAHVPNVNDFVAGFKIVLKPEGVATFEFPHLVNLVRENQFDTIYHEHFSYISILAAERLFTRHRLRIFDVDSLPTHGGSLRLYVCHENAAYSKGAAVARCLEEENRLGFDTEKPFLAFAESCRRVKYELLKFLIAAREQKKLVCAYGAPAKGNTLLNYCGVSTDLVAFTVDRNPHKQGRLLPGSRIPIRDVGDIPKFQPDWILVLPWNLKDEIIAQMSETGIQKGHFVIPIPSLQIV